MLIQRLDPEKFSVAYDVLGQGSSPWAGVAQAPFGATWCVVEPGKAARAHHHQEHETFFIVSGRGRMRIDEETAEVSRGDVIFIEPWREHELTNLSADEDLMFLDLCWEDLSDAVAANEEELAALKVSERPKQLLSTSAPPTPNGDFHVGHLSGPYMRADFHTRYMKMRGVDARHVIWMDDNQSYVVTKAQKLGVTAREVADRFGDLMEETLSLARVELDLVLRPRDEPRYGELVAKMFREHYDRGVLVAREAPTLYCESCEEWLYEARVSGICPHCHQGTDGNACEACGRPNDCVDLLDPKCNKCGSEPATRPQRRIYFPLAPYADPLREYFQSTPMSTHLRSLVEQMLADGLPDIQVSMEVDLGIPVPIPGFEKQKIYVWWEMAFGYLFTARENFTPGSDEFDADGFWAGPERQVVQFFGFDNSYFQTLLHPAIFLASGREIDLPSAFSVNEFMLYEGKKFSTSRDHAVWGQELLCQVPADVARFYLAYEGPETEQTDFSLTTLKEMARRELYGVWQPWLRELGAKVRDHFNGALPGTGAWTEDHRRFFASLNRITSEAAEAYETATFSPRRAVRLMSELVHTARRFGKAEENWRGVPQRYEEWRTAVNLEALAVKALAQISAPVMPDFAAGLRQDLGYEGSFFAGSTETWEGLLELVCSGRDLTGLDRTHFAPFAGEE